MNVQIEIPRGITMRAPGSHCISQNELKANVNLIYPLASLKLKES